MKKLLRRVLLICMTFIIIPTSINALDLTLRWDANTEPDLAGYKLYYKVSDDQPGPEYNGTISDQGPSPIDIPLNTIGFDPENPEFRVTGLLDNRHFLVLTAYDNETPFNESGFSNEVSNKYKLEINIIGAGTVTCNPALPTNGLYGLNQNVELFADPGPDYEFGMWSGSINETVNPVNILMNNDKEITSTFTEIIYTYYNLIVDTNNGGVVDPSGGSYLEGTTATILAIPAANWEFVEWTGDHNGTVNPAEILMDSHKNVQAVFRYPGLAAPTGLGLTINPKNKTYQNNKEITTLKILYYIY